jgi:hypothetical protein
MLYPGGIVFTDCTEIPRRAAASYRLVQKVFERFDEHETPEGTVVYSFGGLRGVADKKVWNDLCLAAAARKRG